jgi:Phage integrase family
VDPQEITEELEHPGARNLLDSATLVRLAYNGSDGFPRVIPIGFYWNGNQIVICTAATAPKVTALSSRPNVADKAGGRRLVGNRARNVVELDLFSHPLRAAPIWCAHDALRPAASLDRPFCISDGQTRGRPWAGAAVRAEFRRLAVRAGVRRCFAPHQLRHAHALELAREGLPLNIIQRQLGHANLGTTSIYLQGIDPEEIISTVWTRRSGSALAKRAPERPNSQRPSLVRCASDVDGAADTC